MSDQEDDTYDKLGKLFLRYIKAENDWRISKSERKYYEVQKCLRMIRSAAKLRNDELNSEQRERNPYFFERNIKNLKNHKEKNKKKDWQTYQSRLCL